MVLDAFVEKASDLIIGLPDRPKVSNAACFDIVFSYTDYIHICAREAFLNNILMRLVVRAEFTSVHWL